MRFAPLFVAALAALVAVPALAANPVNGKKVFEDNCASCHGADGTAVMAGVPHFSKGERLEKPDAQLLVAIRNGVNVMPAWKGLISDTDQADALAYARTLRK